MCSHSLTVASTLFLCLTTTPHMSPLLICHHSSHVITPHMSPLLTCHDSSYVTTPHMSSLLIRHHSSHVITPHMSPLLTFHHSTNLVNSHSIHAVLVFVCHPLNSWMAIVSVHCGTPQPRQPYMESCISHLTTSASPVRYIQPHVHVHIQYMYMYMYVVIHVW